MNDVLEAHLRRLIDLEEIRNLKHRYANLCDDNYQPVEAIADLFTADGVWTGPEGYGHHEGREQLMAFFRTLGDGRALFTIHMVGNEEIHIDGDTAHGRWSTIAPCTFVMDGARADFWGFLRYEDEFVRRDGHWRIRRIKATALAGGTHAGGWATSVGGR